MIDRSFKNWIINLIRFHIQRHFKIVNKRDKKIWAFSAWEGNKYSDNTKFFYEYMKKYHPEIRCIWFTNKINLLNELRKNKNEVYLIGTKESKEMQLKAGVAFYTNGVDDFGKKPYIYGAVIVSLWHGVSFKRIYGAERFKKFNNILIPLRRFKNKFFYWTYRDITCTTSEYMKEKCVEQFYIKNINNVFITGQPRNDLFQFNLNKRNILSDKEIIDSKHIITFMPTWQSFNNNNEIKKLLNQLDKNINFISLLEQYGYKFVIKLHYLSCCNCNYEHLILLNDKDISSSQELLAVTDILITDYSSVFSDFALLDRPIIFYRPDSLQFISETGQYDEFKNVCSLNLVKNNEQLINTITNIIAGNFDYKKQNEIINEYFNDDIKVCGRSSEKIYKIIFEYLNKTL